MNKKDGKRKQFIVFGLCSLLALVLCMVTLVITVEKVEKDNHTIENQVEESKTLLQNDKDVLTAYIFKLTQNSVGNKFVKADFRTEVGIDDGSVWIDGDSSDTKLFVYLKNKVISNIDAIYGDDFKDTFGTVSEKMPLVDLREMEAVSCSFSQGQVDENGTPVLDDEGNLVDADYYFLTFSVDGKAVNDAKSKTAFYADEELDVEGQMKASLSPDCNITFNETQPLEYVIKAKINRFTDEIVNIEVRRNFNINADLEFLNNMSVFGKRNVDFKFSATEIYDYKYAGISFASDNFQAEAGDEISLTVNAVIEDESEYEVKFISSDESVATVDEMGYVQMLKEAPVVITVELRYLGEIFTDECYINAQSVEA